jgi:hypothetical protein
MTHEARASPTVPATWGPREWSSPHVVRFFPHRKTSMIRQRPGQRKGAVSVVHIADSPRLVYTTGNHLRCGVRPGRGWHPAPRSFVNNPGRKDLVAGCDEPVAMRRDAAGCRAVESWVPQLCAGATHPSAALFF